MINIYYHNGQLRTQLAGEVLGRRPHLVSNHSPQPGLVLADIRPADGSLALTGFIKEQ